jgi:hypothetical protein
MSGGRYGGTHAATRRAVARYAVGSACVRCGGPILEGEPWDLDHSDDRTGYLGPAHRRCNRAAGGRKGNALRRQRRRRTMNAVSEVALAVEVSETRGHTSLVTAGRVGHEDTLLELVDYLDGVAGAVGAVLGVRASRKVVSVTIDPHSGAATLIGPLEAAGVTVTQPSTSQATIAHGEFLDRQRGGHIKHVRNHILSTAMKHYTQRRLGEAEVWARRGAPVDVSSAVASALAVWALWNAETYPPADVFF